MWRPMEKIKGFMKKEVVLMVTMLFAVVSCFFVPVDREYIGYFDMKTIISRFTMMAVICAIESTNVLQTVSGFLVNRLKNTRMLFMGLVYLTFISAMFIANNLALLTFLPLSAVVLKATNQENKAMYLFILQNIGANMGGMLTPFGNPQNLYLYNYYNIGTGEFIGIMLPAFLGAIVLLGIGCMLIKKDALVFYMEETPELNSRKLVVCSIAFIISVLMVIKVINYYVGAVIACGIILFLDYKSFKGVDYSLLLTFCAIFVFTGNLSRIEFINSFLSGIIRGRELVVSLMATQVITNLSTAILLSKFTGAYEPILIGVNLGALGTVIASLGSLIAFKLYAKYFDGSKIKYLGMFTGINLCFLAVLVTISVIFVL